jgi:hypothetical protein
VGPRTEDVYVARHDAKSSTKHAAVSAKSQTEKHSYTFSCPDGKMLRELWGRDELPFGSATKQQYIGVGPRAL